MTADTDITSQSEDEKGRRAMLFFPRRGPLSMPTPEAAAEAAKHDVMRPVDESSSVRMPEEDDRRPDKNQAVLVDPNLDPDPEVCPNLCWDPSLFTR